MFIKSSFYAISRKSEYKREFQIRTARSSSSSFSFDTDASCCKLATILFVFLVSFKQPSLRNHLCDLGIQTLVGLQFTKCNGPKSNPLETLEALFSGKGILRTPVVGHVSGQYVLLSLRCRWCACVERPRLI